MRLIVIVLFLTACAVAQLPDTPQPQPAPKRDAFFSFRSNYQAPVLHPTKKSWLIWGVSHAAGWGAMVAACRNPRSGENWGSEAPAMAAVTALDFGMLKFFSPAMSVEGGAYAFGHYAYTARR